MLKNDIEARIPGQKNDPDFAKVSRFFFMIPGIYFLCSLWTGPLIGKSDVIY